MHRFEAGVAALAATSLAADRLCTVDNVPVHSLVYLIIDWHGNADWDLLSR